MVANVKKMRANQRLGAPDGSTHHYLRNNLSKKIFFNLFNLQKIQKTKEHIKWCHRDKISQVQTVANHNEE